MAGQRQSDRPFDGLTQPTLEQMLARLEGRPSAARTVAGSVAQGAVKRDIDDFGQAKDESDRVNKLYLETSERYDTPAVRRLYEASQAAQDGPEAGRGMQYT